MLPAIEKPRVNKDRADSFRPRVDYKPVYVADTLATGSKHRCAELDLHSSSSHIVARHTRAGFNDC
jgi:hypothetical protein